MRLSYRPCIASDFTDCFEAMCDPFAYPSELRSRVPAVWTEWLRLGALTAHVVENSDRQGRRESLGLAGTVFVDPAWLAGARELGQPYLRADLVRRWLNGEKFVLTPAEVRARKNPDDLAIFFVTNALANRSLTDEQRLAVNSVWSEVLYGLRACRFGSLWIEVYGGKSRDWVCGCGMRLKEDWSAHWKRSPQARPATDEQPFLLGCLRDEAARQPGTHVSFLFSNDHALLGFSVRQQELLARAIEGGTDDELARQLNLTSSAVKKRWIAIYDRVSAAMPGWLEATESEATRGTEKRRHLLNHLRKHPAELHPANAARD